MMVYISLFLLVATVISDSIPLLVSISTIYSLDLSLGSAGYYTTDVYFAYSYSFLPSMVLFAGPTNKMKDIDLLSGSKSTTSATSPSLSSNPTLTTNPARASAY
jgi:hypothetical protein